MEQPQSRARANPDPSQEFDLPSRVTEADNAEAVDNLPPRLSATQISAWHDCPRRWGYRYDDRYGAGVEPLPMPDRVLVGSAVHQALAEAASRLAVGLPVDHPPGATLAAYRASAAAAGVTGRAALDEAASYVSYGLALLPRLVGSDPQRIVGVERFFIVDPVGVGLPLSGRMDLLLADRPLDGRLRVRVLDWKASRRERTAAELASDVQMSVYALAAAAAVPDAARVSVGVAALGGGEEPVTWLTRDRPVVAEAVADTVARLAARVWRESRSAAMAGAYEARPDPKRCGGCEFRAACVDSAAPTGTPNNGLY